MFRIFEIQIYLVVLSICLFGVFTSSPEYWTAGVFGCLEYLAVLYLVLLNLAVFNIWLLYLAVLNLVLLNGCYFIWSCLCSCSWFSLHIRWFLFSVVFMFLLLGFLAYLLVRWFSAVFLYCALVPVPVSAGLLVHLCLRDAAAALTWPDVRNSFVTPLSFANHLRNPSMT